MKPTKLTNALLQNFSQGGCVLVDQSADIERRGLTTNIAIREDGKFWITFTWLFESIGQVCFLPDHARFYDRKIVRAWFLYE